MKKVLSILLCAVMVLCCFPLAVSAESIDFFDSAFFTSADQLVSGNEYTIKAGATMTVPADMTLYIPTSATLKVEKGATLNVLGNIQIISGGKLQVEGTIKGGGRVKCEKDNSAFVSLYFTSLYTAGLLDHIENIAFFTSKDPNASVNFNWFDSSNNFDESKVTVVFEEESKMSEDLVEIKNVELNSYIFFKVKFKDFYPNGDPIPASELAKVFDEGKFMILLNDIRVPYSQGCSSVQMSSGGTVTYSQWNNDVDFYKYYNVLLPSGEGYEVVGNYGETSADGTLTIRYGEMFSFRVEIDEAYDMSHYEVYIYNGYGFTDLDTSTILKEIAPAVPNEYGYYNKEITGDTTVYVIGVTKNATITMIGNIVETIRNIFNMLKEFFENLFSMFK